MKLRYNKSSLMIIRPQRYTNLQTCKKEGKETNTFKELLMFIK